MKSLQWLLVLAGFVGCATPARPDGDNGPRATVDMAAAVGPGVGGVDVADMARASLGGGPVDSPADMAMPAHLPGPDLAMASAVDLAMAPAVDLATPPPSCSAAEHLVINEVKVSGTSQLSDEFIELYNPCAQPVTLTSWTLSHFSAQGTSETPIATLTIDSIAGHGYVLIANDNCGCATSADQRYASAAFSADGSGVGLRDAKGTLVDAVGYGSGTSNAFVEDKPAATPGAGKSLGRHPNGVDTDHNQNDFAVASTPTPRAKNP